ncbi:MAG: ferredoxin [Eubacterium sp.]|nr:ferredoxin [Eubacterium sp.]
MESIVKVEMGPNCISCGTCIAMHPAVFEWDEHSRSRLKAGINPDCYMDEITNAAAACPARNIIVK